MAAKNQLEVTLFRSLNSVLKAHRASVRGLGIRKIHQTVVVADTPENRGMIRCAHYLLKWREL